MTENSTFSSSGFDAITQSIPISADTSADQLPPAEFEAYYDIARTADSIIGNGWKRVRFLQFSHRIFLT
jgi:hypothetical protein